MSSFIFGGNEQSTHKYVSELLGKSTIDTNTYGKSSGRNGNYSTNYQNSGRELMTQDEVRLLDNRYALLFIRGERPIIDLKYEVMKHPNVKYTVDGGQTPYMHGKTDNSIGQLIFDDVRVSNFENKKAKVFASEYLLLSEAEVEERILKEELNNEN